MVDPTISPVIRTELPGGEQEHPVLRALRAENARLRAALEKCAAPFDTGPTTLGMAPHIISTEFQRRMNIAAFALISGEATK